jgi:hypothetical protein
MNQRGRQSLKVWAVLLIVFAFGCVTGASLDGLYALFQSQTAAPNEAAAEYVLPSMRDTEAYFEALKRELKLEAAQATEMRVVLDETREQYKAVCADVRPRYDVLREQARARMRALLTSDQQQRFDTIITQEDCKCPEPKK